MNNGERRTYNCATYNWINEGWHIYTNTSLHNDSVGVNWLVLPLLFRKWERFNPRWNRMFILMKVVWNKYVCACLFVETCWFYLFTSNRMFIGSKLSFPKHMLSSWFEIHFDSEFNYSIKYNNFLVCQVEEVPFNLL